MVERKQTDFTLFTHPRILYTERAIDNTAVVFVDQNALRTSRDMLIDYIWVSMEDYSVGGGGIGPNNTQLQFLWLNWNISDRAQWFPEGVVPCQMLHNFWDCDMSVVPNLGAGLCVPTYLWRHTLRWVYNPAQGMTINWAVPASNQQACPILPVKVGLHGQSMRTGHRRLFEELVPFPASAGAAVAGTASVPQTFFNLGDDPYAIESFTWAPSLETFASGDMRVLHHYRMKVQPTWGDAWSEVPVPLILYGIHQGSVNRYVTYKPPGGPLLLKAGQSINWTLDFTRGPAQSPQNVQIALIGRVAYGIGSLT